MIALAVGTILALAALAFVLHPLFAPPERAGAEAAPAAPDDAHKVAVEGLREIEVDREMGKLSDSDYADLKSRYTAEAIAAMRATRAGPALRVAGSLDAAGSASWTHAVTEPPGAFANPAEIDPAEAAISGYRDAAHPRCAVCGPRAEPDARYCSDCGSFLAGACTACGADVSEPGARFCTICGAGL